jgi:hypothetical protein
MCAKCTWVEIECSQSVQAFRLYVVKLVEGVSKNMHLTMLGLMCNDVDSTWEWVRWLSFGHLPVNYKFDHTHLKHLANGKTK